MSIKTVNAPAPAPPPPGTIPAVGTDRCFLVNPSSGGGFGPWVAMVFTTEAILHGYASPPMTAEDPDHDAVWTFVPDNQLDADKFCMLIFWHGWKGWVTVDQSNPDGIKPGWAATRPDPPPNRTTSGGKKVFASGPKYELDQKRDHDPLILVPENGVPNDVKAWGITVAGRLNVVTSQPGRKPVTAPDPPVLGKMVDDCFKHLKLLPRPFLAFAPNASGLLEDRHDPSKLKRMFLTGHSGGGLALSASAASTLAKTIPTDLLLLDCTYGSGTPEYLDFCRTWNSKGLLGRGPGKSRLVMVCQFDNDPNPTFRQADGIRDLLKSSGSAGLGLSFAGPINIDPKRPPAAWPATDMVELAFRSPDINRPPQAMLDLLATAMGKPGGPGPTPVDYKAIYIKTNINHDDIPNVFLPLITASATVP